MKKKLSGLTILRVFFFWEREIENNFFYKKFWINFYKKYLFNFVKVKIFFLTLVIVCWREIENSFSIKFWSNFYEKLFLKILTLLQVKNIF